jgi:hypothetical protein
LTRISLRISGSYVGCVMQPHNISGRFFTTDGCLTCAMIQGFSLSSKRYCGRRYSMLDSIRGYGALQRSVSPL